MARGNAIIVTSDPKGQFDEGVITGALKPGTVLQRDPTVALQGGRHTYKAYDRGADGDRPAGALWILLHDGYQGKTVLDAYVTGTRCFVYSPRPGEQFNLLLADVTGTGDDHTKGEILMVDDGTGKLIATTGSPETESFLLLESFTDPTADQLAWVEYSGY